MYPRLQPYVSRACGLKKPVSQKAEGRPFSSHAVSCSARISTLVNHTPMLGASSCDTAVHAWLG